MKAPWKERLKHWLCNMFGHRKKFSHHYDQDRYLCCRCRRLVGVFSEEKET